MPTSKAYGEIEERGRNEPCVLDFIQFEGTRHSWKFGPTTNRGACIIHPFISFKSGEKSNAIYAPLLEAFLPKSTVVYTYDTSEKLDSTVELHKLQVNSSFLCCSLKKGTFFKNCSDDPKKNAFSIPFSHSKVSTGDTRFTPLCWKHRSSISGGAPYNNIGTVEQHNWNTHFSSAIDSLIPMAAPTAPLKNPTSRNISAYFTGASGDSYPAFVSMYLMFPLGIPMH